jgi:serine/threonine protein kinase
VELVAGTFVTSDLQLLRPLTRGAMGSLWVAHHRTRKRQVAVKFVAAKMARDRNALSRFQREAEAAAQIKNSNVVELLEHGATDDGTPYLVMELLDGETLGERLERCGALSLEAATAVLRQAGNALDAAHARGIVHRDIKPDNIFLVGKSDPPFVKVLDFGMAKQTRVKNQSIITATGVAVGTPEYMSPEQVLGSKDVDFRADLWALAVVTYRMLSGRVPFRGDTPHALFFAICKGEHAPLRLPGLPAELDEWFRIAFAPQRDKRFGSARELVLRFEHAVSGLVPVLPRLGDDDSEEVTNLMTVAHMKPPVVALQPFDEEPSTQRKPPAAKKGLDETLNLDEDGDGEGNDDSDDLVPTRELSARDALAMLAAAEAKRNEAESSRSGEASQPSSQPTSQPSSQPSSLPRPVPPSRQPFNSTPSWSSPLPEPPPRPSHPSSPSMAEVPPPQASHPSSPAIPAARHSSPFPLTRSVSDPGSALTVPTPPATVAATVDDVVLQSAKSSHSTESPVVTGSRADAMAPTLVRDRPQRGLGAIVSIAALVLVAGAVALVVLRSQGHDAPVPQAEAPAASAPAPTADKTSSVAPAASAPVEPAAGHLTIVCEPECTQVLIDETPCPSPCRALGVPAGMRKVVLHRGAAEKVLLVEVEPGEDVTRTVAMGDPAVRGSAPLKGTMPTASVTATPPATVAPEQPPPSPPPAAPPPAPVPPPPAAPPPPEDIFE